MERWCSAVHHRIEEKDPAGAGCCILRPHRYRLPPLRVQRIHGQCPADSIAPALPLHMCLHATLCRCPSSTTQIHLSHSKQVVVVFVVTALRIVRVSVYVVVVCTVYTHDDTNETGHCLRRFQLPSSYVSTCILPATYTDRC